MILSKVYEDAERRLERNEITLGEFERLVDIEVIEPKRGEWIEIKRYWEINQWVYEIECSVCKERIKNPYEPHFCPNCGAKMKGADDE